MFRKGSVGIKDLILKSLVIKLVRMVLRHLLFHSQVMNKNKLKNISLVLNGVGNSSDYNYAYKYSYGYSYTYNYGYGYGYSSIVEDDEK